MKIEAWVALTDDHWLKEMRKLKPGEDIRSALTHLGVYAVSMMGVSQVTMYYGESD